MTSSISIPAKAAPRPRVRNAAAVWAGGIVALIGTVVVVAAAAVLIAFGEDSTLASDVHSLSTSTAALVSPVATIEDTSDVARTVGSPHVQLAAQADGDQGVFVGIGRAADVDRYLANAPIAKVTDLELMPYKLQRKVRGGDVAPAAPTGQDFWVAQSSGTRAAEIDWKVRDGDYRAVVMNADGSLDVAAWGTFGIRIPHISPIALVLLIGGLVMAVGGLVALVRGAQRVRPQ